MRRAVAFVLLGVLAGCGASPPRVPAPSEIAGLPEVTVRLDPQVDAERARVFSSRTALYASGTPCWTSWPTAVAAGAR